MLTFALCFASSKNCLFCSLPKHPSNGLCITMHRNAWRFLSRGLTDSKMPEILSNARQANVRAPRPVQWPGEFDELNAHKSRRRVTRFRTTFELFEINEISLTKAFSQTVRAFEPFRLWISEWSMLCDYFSETNCFKRFRSLKEESGFRKIPTGQFCSLLSRRVSKLQCLNSRLLRA